MEYRFLLTQVDTEEAVIEALQKNPGIIRSYLERMVPSFVNFIIQVLVAVFVLYVGSRGIRLIVRALEKSLKRNHAEPGVTTFLSSLVRYVLYFCMLMIILSAFGVTTSSIVAILGSAGLTLGLALQGSLSNFAGGVLIMLLKPFVVGDYIADGSSGKEGTVQEITIFYTRLLSVDNKMIVIPNGSLSNACITNYTHMDKRRVDLCFGVDYRTNLAEAKRVLAQVAENEPGIISGEPVEIFVDSLGDSSVQLGMRVWVRTTEYWAVRWRITENVKNALDENGISIPFPQLDVKIKQSGGEKNDNQGTVQ